MYDTINALGFETLYNHAANFSKGLCPYCNEPVKELYPDNGHSFRTMDKWILLVNWWCECTNPLCPGPGRFKASQPYVLAGKKFGQDVWIAVCMEWEAFKSSPKEIKKRMRLHGVMISDDVIADILDAYKLLKEGHVDEETRRIAQKQGRIIIGCDGTPSETGKPSFWTFYDVISGRILHAELLEHADNETLLRIFRSIKEKYGVPVVGFLSDHQPSIMKACEEFDPSLPHQTCHFHFLRNHWMFIEAVDTHLNKELRVAVNALPIMSKDTNGGAFYSPGIKVDKQDFFAPLTRLLEKSVNFKDKTFSQLKGVLSFEALEQIVTSINVELKTCDPNLRPAKQLQVSRDLLVDVLDKMRPCYKDIKELDGVFQMIRITIADESLSKQEKIHQLGQIYTMCWHEHKAAASYRSLDDLKTLQPEYFLSKDLIFCQWRRLWDSHVDGLFYYMSVEGMEKTNIFNEQMFGNLRRDIVKAHGAAHEAHMILTRGALYVKCAGETSEAIVKKTIGRYDRKVLESLGRPLRECIAEQVAWYRNAPLITDAVHIVAQNIRNMTWEKK
jgi:hypothetical protein